MKKIVRIMSLVLMTLIVCSAALADVLPAVGIQRISLTNDVKLNVITYSTTDNVNDLCLSAHQILIHNEVYCSKGRNGGGTGEELLKSEGCGVLAAIAVEAVANVAKEYGIVEFHSGSPYIISL